MVSNVEWLSELSEQDIAVFFSSEKQSTEECAYENFDEYKQLCTLARSSLEKHLNNCMINILQGLPEVADEDTDEEGDFHFLQNHFSFTCPACKSINEPKNEKCRTCGTKKPDFTIFKALEPVLSSQGATTANVQERRAQIEARRKQ